MTDIKIGLELEAQETNGNTLSSLQEWIRREQIIGLKRVERPVGESKPEEMGIDPVTVLSVVLGSRAVTELVKSIHVWIQATRPKVKMKMTFYLEEKIIKVLEIDAENLPKIKLLIEEIVKRLQTENSSETKALIDEIIKQMQEGDSGD